MQEHPITPCPLPTAAAWWPRFAEKFEVAESGCWLWRRRIDRDGYGRFGIGSTSWYAHRAAYVALIGPIPDETLDHLCHNADDTCPGGRACLHRRCVNPWHLDPATNVENVMRGQAMTAVAARRDACGNGHPWSAETIYWWQGQRHCRVCRLAASRARMLRDRQRKVS